MSPCAGNTPSVMTRGLDPAGIKMVRELFRNIAKENKTIFMSTHTLKVAEDVCDRIGIINKGRLIAAGTFEELRQMAKTDKKGLEEGCFVQIKCRLI